MATTAAQDEHGMSRMQELLSSYYGMQDRESEEESLRNIDSKGFDSKTYVKVRDLVVLPSSTRGGQELIRCGCLCVCACGNRKCCKGAV